MVCAGFTPHFAGSVSISGVLVVLLPFSPLFPNMSGVVILSEARGTRA